MRAAICFSFCTVYSVPWPFNLPQSSECNHYYAFSLMLKEVHLITFVLVRRWGEGIVTYCGCLCSLHPIWEKTAIDWHLVNGLKRKEDVKVLDKILNTVESPKDLQSHRHVGVHNTSIFNLVINYINLCSYHTNRSHHSIGSTFKVYLTK